jgi:predicted component of viral defense system (DUF524 family)
MVLLRNPAYRAALSGYQELHRDPHVRHTEPLLDAPLRNLPKLYQIWGTLSIFDALMDVAANLGFELLSQNLARRVRRTAFVRVLPDGQPALVFRDPSTGAEVRAIPERSYGKTGALRSFTYTQVPDIAIEIKTPDQQTRVILFDPKYKLWSERQPGGTFKGRPKKTDIDKMHAYRDSIRDASGRRVVEYAAILYPGRSYGFRVGIGAIGAIPGAESEFGKVVSSVLSRALPAAANAAKSPEGVG